MLLKSSGTSFLCLAKFPWALLCRLAKAKVICLSKVFSPHCVASRPTPPCIVQHRKRCFFLIHLLLKKKKNPLYYFVENVYCKWTQPGWLKLISFNGKTWNPPFTSNLYSRYANVPPQVVVPSTRRNERHLLNESATCLSCGQPGDRILSLIWEEHTLAKAEGSRYPAHSWWLLAAVHAAYLSQVLIWNLQYSIVRPSGSVQPWDLLWHIQLPGSRTANCKSVMCINVQCHHFKWVKTSIGSRYGRRIMTVVQ